MLLGAQCSSCAAPVEAADRFCWSCGHELVEELDVLDLDAPGRRRPPHSLRPEPGPNRRRRNAAVAIATLALGLVVIGIINSATGNDGAVPTTAVPTTAVPTTAPPATASPPTTTAPATSGSTTPRRPPTTVPVDGTTIVPGAPLLGEPTGLVVYLSEQHLERLDLDTGVAATVIRNANDINSVVPVAGGVVVWRSAGLTLVRDGGEVVELHEDVSAVFASTEPGRFWMAAWAGTGATVAEYDLDGNETTPSSSLPAFTDVIGARRDGLVLRAADGGHYRFDPRSAGVSRLPDGEAGLSRSQLELVCSDGLVCSWQVRDPAGALLGTFAAGAEEFGQPEPSPDGRWLYVRSDGGGEVIEVASGTRRAVPVVIVGRGAQWSPDGRWLFGISSDGRAAAIDLTSGAPRALGRRGWPAAVTSR